MKNIIGNKAENLIELTLSGVKVPRFVCINNEECKTLKIDNLKKKIKELGFPVIVRSSSEGEDALKASGAGKYNSIYNIQNDYDLYKAIKLCWQSKGDLYAMGIIVQKQVIPKYSGVAFIQKQGDRVECIIEAVFGLGDVLVSGYATPKRIMISLDTDLWETIEDDNQRVAQIPRIDKTVYEPTDDIIYGNCRLRIIGVNSRIIYGYMLLYYQNINKKHRFLVLGTSIEPAIRQVN